MQALGLVKYPTKKNSLKKSQECKKMGLGQKMS